MEEIRTTISPEHYFLPLTYDEFWELKAKVEAIGVNLPENQLAYLWNNYNQIRGVNESRPCSCQSAASHWIACVEFLKEWVKSKTI